MDGGVAVPVSAEEMSDLNDSDILLRVVSVDIKVQAVATHLPIEFDEGLRQNRTNFFDELIGSQNAAIRERDALDLIKRAALAVAAGATVSTTSGECRVWVSLLLRGIPCLGARAALTGA